MSKSQTSQGVRKVSIVIPVYNGEETIRECLLSVLDAEYPEKEVIVMDDGSTDKTPEILEEFSDRARVFRNEHRGRSPALNEGWRIATGEIVYFVDADCVMDKDAISRIVSHFEDEGVVGVWGEVKALNRSRLLPLINEASMIVSRREGVKISSVAGANMSFRGAFLEEIGGFENAHPLWGVTGEDVEIMYKMEVLGYKHRYEPKAIIYTELPETLKELLKKGFRNAKIFPRVVERAKTTSGLKTIMRNLGYYGLLTITFPLILVDRLWIIPVILFLTLLTKYFFRAVKIYRIVKNLKILFLYPFLEMLLGYTRFFAYLSELRRILKIAQA